MLFRSSTKKALEKIDGVTNVDVNLEKNEASDDGDVDSSVVKEAIVKIGFEVVSLLTQSKTLISVVIYIF